jgi:hypothetical protein
MVSNTIFMTPTCFVSWTAKATATAHRQIIGRLISVHQVKHPIAYSVVFANIQHVAVNLVT